MIKNRKQQIVRLFALALCLGAPGLFAVPGAGGSQARLEVETRDIAASRRAMLGLVDRFGRIETLESKRGDAEASAVSRLEARVLVPAESLAGFLAESGTLGRTVTEAVGPAPVAAEVPAGHARIELILTQAAPVAAPSAPSAAWPNYGEAFVGLGHFLARVLYVLILLAPLWLLVGALLWKRRAIAGFFAGMVGSVKRSLPARAATPSASGSTPTAE